MRLAGGTVREKLQLNSRPDGSCLRWTGAHSRTGYGRIRVAGKTEETHRVAHLEFIGPIPAGAEVDHVAKRGCRFRDCINPSHLEAVSHDENIARIADRYQPPAAEAAALIRAWESHVALTAEDLAVAA